MTKSKFYNQKNHLIKVFMLILFFWLILSGVFSLFMLFLGLLSSLFVLFIVNKMDLIDQETSLHNFNIFRLLKYLAWLFKEIIVSNIKVCSIIINSSKVIESKVIKVKSSQQSEFAHIIYANSITLTPGTVTIDVDEDTFTIHTLDESFKKSVESGEMNKKIKITENNNV